MSGGLSSGYGGMSGYGGGGGGYGGGYGARRMGFGGGGDRPRTGTCYEFQSNGTCKYGDNCRFNHTAGGGGGSGYGGGGYGGGSRFSSSGEGRYCHNFRNTGECRYGDACKFSHDSGAGASEAKTAFDGQPSFGSSSVSGPTGSSSVGAGDYEAHGDVTGDQDTGDSAHEDGGGEQ